MRLLKFLTFVALIAAAVVLWWGNSDVNSAPPSSSALVQETTQLSKLPPPKAQPERPAVMVKKATGADLLAKGVPFVQRHKLDGPPGNDASPMDRYRGLKFGGEVKLNGRGQLVLGARAVPTPRYNSSFGPVLFEKNGYSIVGLDTAADPTWNQMLMHESDRPVVINPANGRLGIVTGTLMIKFSDLHQADKLAGRENLQLVSLDESIGVGYFKAPENYRLLGAIERLSREPDVLRVELEVVDSIKGAW